MSRETIEDLNINTLIGFTDKRGTAWHYRADQQGDESNHYPGAMPIEDVRRRLFGWTAVSRRMAIELPADMNTMTHLSDDGEPLRWALQEDLQAMCRSDDHYRMGIFTEGYRGHQYQEWLLGTVATILDDNLAISSAGLLRRGAVAWVEVSVPESITTPEGCDVPAEPAGDHQLRRLHRDHVQAHRHRHRVRQHPRDGAVRAGSGVQGQAHPQQPDAHHRRP